METNVEYSTDDKDITNMKNKLAQRLNGETEKNGEQVENGVFVPESNGEGELRRSPRIQSIEIVKEKKISSPAPEEKGEESQSTPKKESAPEKTEDGEVESEEEVEVQEEQCKILHRSFRSEFMSGEGTSSGSLSASPQRRREEEVTIVQPKLSRDGFVGRISGRRSTRVVQTPFRKRKIEDEDEDEQEGGSPPWKKTAPGSPAWRYLSTPLKMLWSRQPGSQETEHSESMIVNFDEKTVASDSDIDTDAEIDVEGVGGEAVETPYAAPAVDQPTPPPSPPPAPKASRWNCSLM